MEFQNDLLKTSWPGANGKLGGVFAQPFLFLVPLYHKIRIPYKAVFDMVSCFDDTLKVICKLAEGVKGIDPKTLESLQGLEWDIYLTTVSEYKKDVMKMTKLAGDKRHSILQDSMPRFLWRATALAGREAVFDFIFDATDIEQGNVLFRIEEYAELVAETLSILMPIVSRKSPRLRAISDCYNRKTQVLDRQ
jgi:hypothetical protein